jgi:hypothetical protein
MQTVSALTTPGGRASGAAGAAVGQHRRHRGVRHDSRSWHHLHGDFAGMADARAGGRPLAAAGLPVDGAPSIRCTIQY